MTRLRYLIACLLVALPLLALGRGVSWPATGCVFVANVTACVGPGYVGIWTD